MTKREAEKRVVRAAMRYCRSRDKNAGDGTEQWHDWRNMPKDERALYAAYRALAKLGKGRGK